MIIHNLLWTSGWDSTYRLLEIILIEKENVRPIYIKDKDRKSLNTELATIEKIKNKIKQDYPEAYDLILPTWFAEKENINVTPAIIESYDYINRFKRMGNQYNWLAQFCADNRLTNIEISLENDLSITSFSHFLNTNYITTNYSNAPNKELYSKMEVIFGYFSFPIHSITKQDMLVTAKKNNWDDIMHLTWFCHKPKKNNPCGKCKPCVDAIKQNFGYRIPMLSRLKGNLKIFYTDKKKLLTQLRTSKK
jgi:hypothetical protein